jgi:hypothetical protein
MEKQLAKITNAKLEILEREILNFWIYVDYENGGSQGVGGLILDDYSVSLGRRIGTAYGCEMIRRLLLTLKVNDFNEMSGLIVWVYGEGEGLNFKPKGISRLRTESRLTPLMFDEVYEQFLNGEK